MDSGYYNRDKYVWIEVVGFVVCLALAIGGIYGLAYLDHLYQVHWWFGPTAIVGVGCIAVDVVIGIMLLVDIAEG